MATVRSARDNLVVTLKNKKDYLIKVEKQLETCEEVNCNLHDQIQGLQKALDYERDDRNNSLAKTNGRLHDQVHGLELELDRQKERNETLAKANGRLSAAGCDADADAALRGWGMMFKHQVVILDVTQDDIDHGHPCNSTKCPVATALIRALGGGPEIAVSVSCVNIAFIQDGEVYA